MSMKLFTCGELRQGKQVSQTCFGILMVVLFDIANQVKREQKNDLFYGA